MIGPYEGYISASQRILGGTEDLLTRRGTSQLVYGDEADTDRRLMDASRGRLRPV
jgi:hypothetical protein